MFMVLILILMPVPISGESIKLSSINLRMLERKGEPFYSIGMNRFFVYISENNRDNLTPEEYLKLMKASGMNTVRVFVAEPGFEPRVGEYSHYYLNRLDNLFQIAEKEGVYIILALFDHYAFRFRWSESAYNRKNGGPVSYPYQIFTLPAAIAYQKARIKFLVERYSSHPALLAWEPINEVNGVSPDHIPMVLEKKNWHDICFRWIELISGYIREIDPHNHPITVSLTGDNFWPELFFLPTVDIVQIHTYRETNDPFKLLKVIKNYASHLEKMPKPTIIAEFAPRKEVRERAKFISFGIWSAWAKGMSAFPWTHKNDPFGDLTDEDFQQFLPLSRVASQVNWNRPWQGSQEHKFHISPPVELFSCRIGNQILGWMAKFHPSFGPVTVRLKDLSGSEIEVFWFSPDTGECLRRELTTLSLTETLFFSPPFIETIALILKIRE